MIRHYIDKQWLNLWINKMKKTLSIIVIILGALLPFITEPPQILAGVIIILFGIRTFYE